MHGVTPKCDPLPALPADITAGQIQSNIDEAQRFYGAQQIHGPDVALYALYGFLAGKFSPGGDWDYKKSYTKGSADQAKARVFGNFDFGAVIESFGFSYNFTQNAAGIAQVGICLFGGACGKGIPFITFPYGDQISDAADVKRGYNYQKKQDSGCH